MSKRGLGDKVDKLVEAKFTGCTIDRKGDSPNARHFVIQKDGQTKHLKVVKKAYIDANAFSEIELLKSIDSDYVVKLEDYGDLDAKYVFLLFPHIDGTTLDKMRKPEGWDEESLKTLIKDVVSGLRDLGKAGIVHQDIKPKNIIYDNRSRRYILLDLGIGFFIEGPNKNNTAIPKGEGPKYYSAPEQFKIAIREPYSLFQTVDQFSFGAVLYELATGIHPFIEINDAEAQSYATLVMDDKLPRRIPRGGKLSATMCGVIERTLSKEPSQRYLNLEGLEDALSIATTTETAKPSVLYLKMPSKGKDEFIEIVQKEKDRINGIFLSPSDSTECAKKIDDLGIPIILDPKTYNLQVNDSTEQLSKKLGIPFSAAYNILSLYKLKDQLLEGAHHLSTKMYSSKIVLPYFNIEGVGAEYLSYTKELWCDARQHYQDKGLSTDNLYGSLIVPYSVLVSKKERAKLMSQLMAKYPLDGVIVTFENVDKSVATTSEIEYLKGLKEMVAFFEAIFKEVIIYQTDLSVLPFVSKASYATGWSKKSRHFNTTKVGGNGKNRPPYKMKLFARELFTFVEEKSKVQIIVLMGKAKYLQCDCVDCEANDPLSPSYKENEPQEKRHFYRGVADMYAQISKLKPMERRNFFKGYLGTCEKNGLDVKSSGAIGNETIPSYEGLVSLIDN